MNKWHNYKVVLERCKSLNKVLYDMCINANNILRNYSRVQSFWDGWHLENSPNHTVVNFFLPKNPRFTGRG